MRVNPAEIIDRMSIVKLKIEKLKNQELNKEMDALKEALEEYKKEGVEIKNEWFEELYEINELMWDLLDKVLEEKKKENLDYEKFGRLYVEIDSLNDKRSKIKNKIIEETKKGFREIRKRD